MRDLHIWIGDESALEVAFCAEVDITAVLYIRHQSTQPQLPTNALWLTKQKSNELVHFLSVLIEQKSLDEYELMLADEPNISDVASRMNQSRQQSKMLSKRSLLTSDSNDNNSFRDGSLVVASQSGKVNEAWETFQRELPVIIAFAKQQAQV